MIVEDPTRLPASPVAAQLGKPMSVEPTTRKRAGV